MSKPRSTASATAVPASPGISVVWTGLALLLVGLGIGYVVYYLTGVLDDGTPKRLADLKDWNWVIGFGLLFLGLAVAARPSTPLGRGRGVVIGMLGCFLIGLLWIVFGALLLLATITRSGAIETIRATFAEAASTLCTTLAMRSAWRSARRAAGLRGRLRASRVSSLAIRTVYC